MPPTSAVRAASSPRSASTTPPTLRRGARGAVIRELQLSLRRAGFAIPADGNFGPKTLGAVRAFQRRTGLPVDGVAGPRTQSALRTASSSSRIPASARLAPTAAPTAATATRVGTAYRNGRATTIRLAPVGNNQFLEPEAAGRYKQMIAAARAAGIPLTSTSGFRTNAQQAALFRRYGAGRASRPGYSNHQQGLSMDIGGVRGYGTRAYKWLQANASRFGFVNDVRGEYWHWTYRR